MPEKEVFGLQKKQLVESMKLNQAVGSKAVEEAFLKVPREEFVSPQYRSQAYSDTALPIGFFQTISQPSTIAAMLELLEVKPGQKVLEVGLGSGYVAALLSNLVGEKGKVYAIEFLKGLIDFSKSNLERTGVKNVEIIQGDGSQGLQAKAPFDRILVSCACPFIPKPLVDQLAEKGRIVAPVGDLYMQYFEVIQKIKGKILKKQASDQMFVFVPLRGKYGFQKDSF